MAAQPVKHQPSHDQDASDVPSKDGASSVQPVDAGAQTMHVASPARALQERVLAELSQPASSAFRRIFGMVLVVCLSTWFAAFIFYAVN
ncbi:hypothetical protein [Hyphomonas johnsonii]|uniref:hypothetical protein n=1 Tax=Hyphomonas johnsonii TaxID=81031 RepID=UPI00054F5207|nr:hypothetical protein [Hyphomonas johnsonii]